MIIKRIELVNYCQHVSRTIDISGNLIAVVGHNGCGKSNMLGALQFALTGEQPGKNKADLLHWGAKEGKVILDFEQDGKAGRIERAVGSNKVTLEYDGVTTTGITAVAKEMEDRLHVDKDLVKQSVFVRQTEVDTIISAKTDKRDREVAFQKLLGLDAAKIHKNLTDWMYAATKPVNYDIQLNEAAQRLGMLEARKAEMETAVEKAGAELAAYGSEEEPVDVNLQQSIATITAVLQAQSADKSCEEAAYRANEALAAVKAKVPDAGEDPRVDVSTRLSEKAALQEEIRKHATAAAAESAYVEAERLLASETAASHPDAADIAQSEERLASATNERASVQHEIDTRKKALGALSGGESVCPVCGKPLDADMVEHLRQEMTGFEARLQELNTRIAVETGAVNSMRTQKSSYDTRVLAATQRMESAKKALDAVDRPAVPKDIAESEIVKIDDDIRRQQTYDRATSAYTAAISEAEVRADVAKKARDEAAARLEAATAAAVDLCGAEAAADWQAALTSKTALTAAAESRRKRIGELRVALAQATAARDEVCNSLVTLKGTVESLQAEQAKQDELAKRLAVIEKVRDWFSYQNGPRVLVQQVLGALTDDVNRFLGNFTAPFVVTPDSEQLGFRVQFTDGRDHPEDPPSTDVLSGGERVQLAVAFRLAIYCMFAGKLGMLSLDEPTAYLDDGNVDRFGVLLTKVRELARNMNTQVFMATHERSVIPHMDSVIDLN